MKQHAAAWVKGSIKYGIGFGLLALVIARYWADDPNGGAPGLRTLLGGPVDFGWLALASVLIAAGLSCQLVRWYILVRALDLPFGVRNAFRLGLVGVFANTFLPGAVGGDLLKAYFLAREQPERKTRAVASVIADRALGLFGLILFVAVLGSVAWALGDSRITTNAGLQKMVQVTGLIAAASGAGFLLLGLLPQRRVDRFAGRLRWLPVVGRSCAELWYAVWMYRQRLKAVGAGVALSAVSHLGLVFAFHCAARVFPPENADTDRATLAEHLVIAPIGFIVQALPLSPGGVGVGEAAFAGLYRLSGRPESRGVIARLSLRLVEWIIGLVGYLVYLRMTASREIPAIEEVEDEAEAEARRTDGTVVAPAEGG